MPRLDALSKHWKDIPPLHIELARIGAALGVPRPDSTPTKDEAPKQTFAEGAENSDEAMMELFAMFQMKN